MVESIVCYKYREGTGNILDNPTPLYISVPWAIFFIYITVTWLYLRFKPGHTVKFIEIEDGVKKSEYANTNTPGSAVNKAKKTN
jgi:hypothetical protein